MCLSVCPSIFFFRPSIHLSFYLRVYLSVCLSDLCLYLYLFLSWQASYDDITVFVVPLHVHNRPATSGEATVNTVTDDSSSAPSEEAAASTSTGTAAADTNSEDASNSAGEIKEAGEERQPGSTPAIVIGEGTELQNVLGGGTTPASDQGSTRAPLVPGSPISSSVSLSSFVVVDAAQNDSQPS